MIWQLLQVRHMDNVPLILVGRMWKDLVEWAKVSMLDPRVALANAEDLQIPRCLDTADDAIALVRDFHQVESGAISAHRSRDQPSSGRKSARSRETRPGTARAPPTRCHPDCSWRRRAGRAAATACFSDWREAVEPGTGSGSAGHSSPQRPTPRRRRPARRTPRNNQPSSCRPRREDTQGAAIGRLSRPDGATRQAAGRRTASLDCRRVRAGHESGGRRSAWSVPRIDPDAGNAARAKET